MVFSIPSLVNQINIDNSEKHEGYKEWIETPAILSNWLHLSTGMSLEISIRTSNWTLDGNASCFLDTLRIHMGRINYSLFPGNISKN